MIEYECRDIYTGSFECIKCAWTRNANTQNGLNIEQNIAYDKLHIDISKMLKQHSWAAYSCWKQTPRTPLEILKNALNRLLRE